MSFSKTKKSDKRARVEEPSSTPGKKMVQETSADELEEEPVKGDLNAMSKLNATIEALNANLSADKDVDTSLRATVLRRLKIKTFEPDWGAVEVIKEPLLWLVMLEEMDEEDVFGKFGSAGPLLQAWRSNAREEWI